MFWERLYYLCTKHSCKPNTVAKAIGLSTAIATKWKNGTIPNGETLTKIADYFNCSVDYLLGRTDISKIIDISNVNKEKENYEYREGYKQGYRQACEDIKDKINDLTMDSFTERG